MPVGGIGGAMMGGAMQMAIDAANAEAEQRRLEFLQAQRQQLQQELNTLMQKEVKPAGQLEQNAFQAQADAFKQIVENMSNRPNPQTTRIINLITSIDAALRNGGVIKVVP
jgi:DNA-binding transcriptional MerR regulator